MWTLFVLWKKQAVADVDTAPKKCRICWRGEDEGEEEEWVAPCRCPRTVAWVHRRCLAWRLKHTPIEEDKQRCAVCKHAYKKRFRVKTLREWFDGWKGDWLYWVIEMARFLLLILSNCYSCRLAHGMGLNPKMVSFGIPFAIGVLLGVVQGPLRDYFGYPEDEGLLLGYLLPYKRLLTVVVHDWYLDAPPPLRDSSSSATTT